MSVSASCCPVFSFDLSATIATVDVVLFLGFPGVNYTATPTASIGKLYANSLVMMLNARSDRAGSHSHISDGGMFELHPSRRAGVSSNLEGGLGPIRVTTISHQVTDRSDKSVSI